MRGGSRVVVVPCPPGLLPEYRGLSDPWSDLRAASVAAVEWLVADLSDPVLVLCPAPAPMTEPVTAPMTEPGGRRVGSRAARAPAVAEHLLGAAGHRGGAEVATVPEDVTDHAGQRPEDCRPGACGGRNTVETAYDAGHVDHVDLRGRAVLALADGSARRGDLAPGYIDERAFAFDAAIGSALRAGDLAALHDLDVGLGAALLAEGVPVLRRLGCCLGSVETAEVTYDDDPFGVQYWVARWHCPPH